MRHTGLLDYARQSLALHGHSFTFEVALRGMPRKRSNVRAPRGISFGDEKRYMLLLCGYAVWKETAGPLLDNARLQCWHWFNTNAPPAHTCFQNEGVTSNYGMVGREVKENSGTIKVPSVVYPHPPVLLMPAHEEWVAPVVSSHFF